MTVIPGLMWVNMKAELQIRAFVNIAKEVNAEALNNEAGRWVDK